METTQVLLIVDSHDDNGNELQQALKDNNFLVVAVLNIDEDFNSSAYTESISVLVCQFHKVKTAYLDTIANLVQNHPCPIILFTRDDSSDAIDQSVQMGVNAYIVDGLDSKRIKSIIEVATSRFKGDQKIINELQKTRQQLENRKLIDRAKGILMQGKKMDEQQAYQTIRKMAMDKSKSMGDIAKSIIDVMEIMD